MCRLVTDNLQDLGRAEVQLIQEEDVRVNRLQPERLERSYGEVADVGGHDGLRACPDGRRDNMPVVVIRQRDPGLKFRPSSDDRVVECFAHVGEAFLDVDAGMDLLDGLLGLGQDPF